jgi:hypothetical protein
MAFYQMLAGYQRGLQPAATDSWQGDDDDEESQLSYTSSQLSSTFSQPQVFGPPRPPQVVEVPQHGNTNQLLWDINRHQSQATYPEILSLTTADVLSAGLLYAGFDRARQQRNNENRKIEWFKAFYGVEPTTVVPFFEDLRIDYPDISYKDALMTMNWLYLYDTYPVLSGRWKCCEEYIGSKVIEYGMYMANLGRKKIIFELNNDVELGRTVDCSTFMVQEFRLDPSSEWFDHKTHSCGLKYEYCLAIDEPRVVHMRGPFAPSIHDITVFRGGDPNDEDNWDPDALYFKLEEGEKCVGDSGYAGEPAKVVVTKDEHSSEFKEFLARAKNRQETFHWRLKSFNILGHRFRHGVNTQDKMDLHKMANEAVVGIVQYDYDNGHPPFGVR